MRKSIVLTACALAAIVFVVVIAVVNDQGGSPDDVAVAQDSDQAPILEKEVRSWCPDSCSGGNDEYESNPATFTLRPDGSMHFVTDVNYAACPRMTIPDEIDGWYFGTSKETIASQFATATVTGEPVIYETSGVQQFDDDSRNNEDLMICEAVFFRGGD